MDKLDSELLLKVADLHSVPQGAYNIRKNGELLARNCVEGIEITTKEDKPGIDIHVAENLKGESIHIPVIVTEGDLQDLVYNDFYVGNNAEVLIVAGCGLHNEDNKDNSHTGIHEFWIGENAVVRYVEKHYAQGDTEAEKNLDPTTIVHLAENTHFVMETVQLGGVTHSERVTEADLDDFAVLEVKESILTEGEQDASTTFSVELNGKNSKVNVISRSVAKGNSEQEFISEINGNNESFGHVECDAIVFDNAQVSSTPALRNTHPDAQLTHEAAIGKIAGEQIIKLQTLGLTKEQAEESILKGFLNEL